jgi:site-specific DNA-methyltransferase (adenine-specific)
MKRSGGLPTAPLSDVRDWEYTGNRFHPRSPSGLLLSLAEGFSGPGAVVLDPFCGSGSTLVAAKRRAAPFWESK